MLVKCGAKMCIYNQNGMCTSESVEIVDVEENENIKMKDQDFMVCKTIKWN